MIVLFFCFSCTEQSTSLPTNLQQDVDSGADDSANSFDSSQPEDRIRICELGTVPISDGNSSYCMMTCEAAFFEEQALSEVGVSPASNISFYRAKELCENTWVESAETFMRLPTFAEWLDAGDGVYGEGGSAYPWGDSFHDGECVLPHLDVDWDGWQVCGFLSSCQSDFGVWDQIGNLWEWVDSGNTVDLDRWFDARREEGIMVSTQNGFLSLDAGSLQSFVPFAVGLPFAHFIQEDGIVYIVTEEPFREDLPGDGYLKPIVVQGMATAEDMLPIHLSWDDTRMRAAIEVVQERNGEPIGAKVGGSYYSGAQARLDTIFWGHVPSFDGTIGFRCVYDWDN